jgi:hypothetical protein
MMTVTPFKTLTVDGEDIAIGVTEDGHFHATIDGQQYHHAILSKLEEIVRTQRRAQTKLAVPATMLDDELSRRPYTHIVITGRHAGNNNILYHDEGSTQTQQHYRSYVIYRRLSAQEIDAYKELLRRKVRLEREIDRFRAARVLKVDQALATARAKDPA